MERRLTKSNDKRLCGVCGGIAEYFGLDATIVRWTTAILAFFCSPVVIMYFAAALIMPDKEV